MKTTEAPKPVLTPEERLKQVGVLPTSQRVLLLSLLMRKDYHPTAYDLELDANQHDKVSTTTVYLSLRLFVASGLVHSFPDRAGKVRYGGYPEPHAHLLCVVCGTVVDIPNFSLPKPAAQDWKTTDLPPLVVGYGLCPTCRRIVP